jgi:hypothetical protein
MANPTHPPCYQPGAALLVEMFKRETPMTHAEAIAWQEADWLRHQKEHGCRNT